MEEGTRDRCSALLGFGLMRLPRTGEGDNLRVDVAEVQEMVDAFISAGFTYFDTAWGYLGGKSELAAKETLVDRYPRESFQLATKLPAWEAKSAKEARAMFDTSLERTGAGYFDCYLLHNLGEERTRAFDDFGLWGFVRDLRERGLVKRMGFSIHDKAEALDALLDAHPDVDFVQLQINYADWESPKVESRKCYEVARAHDVPIIVMEPVKGGSLVKLSDVACEPLRKLDPSAPVASWALRFAASLPGVERVLSGMSTIDQVRENIEVMRDFKPLSDDELSAIERTRAVLAAEQAVPCTDCRYCTAGCPQGVAIPVILDSLNILKLYGDEQRARENIAWNAGEGRAEKCIACGACEAVCPQHIKIAAHMQQAAELFDCPESAGRA